MRIVTRSAILGLSRLGVVLLVLLILLLLGAFPGAGLHNFGYGPMGVVGVLLFVLLVLIVAGHL